MRFIIDENVRTEVKDFLESAGHDVLLLKPGSSDTLIARTARETNRIIITHDKHFADILMYDPKEYSGIIRIKIHPPVAVDIINALKNLFKELRAAQFVERLIVLERDGFRIR